MDIAAALVALPAPGAMILGAMILIVLVVIVLVAAAATATVSPVPFVAIRPHT